MTQRTSQRSEILRHLRKHKSLTALEALHRFGCMRLAARISELNIQLWSDWSKSQRRLPNKAPQIGITKKMVRIGEKRVARYSLNGQG